MEKNQSLCYTKNGGDNEMAMLRYTFMNDTLFKMLFTKHPELLVNRHNVLTDKFVMHYLTLKPKKI
jgi:hypothetical protein